MYCFILLINLLRWNIATKKMMFSIRNPAFLGGISCFYCIKISSKEFQLLPRWVRR